MPDRAVAAGGASPRAQPVVSNSVNRLAPKGRWDRRLLLQMLNNAGIIQWPKAIRTPLSSTPPCGIQSRSLRTDVGRSVEPGLRGTRLEENQAMGHLSCIARRRSAGLCSFAGLFAMLSHGAPSVAAPPIAGFIDQSVWAGFNRGVGLEFDHRGRIFVWEQGGRVWIVQNGVRLSPPFLDLSDEVYEYVQHGLLGFALDPDFATNGHVYLLYAVDWAHYSTGGAPGPRDQQRDTFGRLVRYTADPANDQRTALPASRWVMIGATHDVGFPCTSGSHGSGSIVFGTDGTMLVTHGDGATWQTPFDIGGLRASDPQGHSSNTAEADGIIGPREQVGAFRAQIVDSFSGKVLRLDPATGQGVPSNPFFDPLFPGAPRSMVWALGLRNPYRASLRPGTGSTNPADANPGSLYIGDVGWQLWEELNVARTGGLNFGWPNFEGQLPSPSYPTTNVANRDRPNPLFGMGGCTQEFFRFTDLIRQESLNPLVFANPCDAGQMIPADFTFEHARPIFDYWHSGNRTRLPIFNPMGEAATIDLGAPGAPAAGTGWQGSSMVGGSWFNGQGFPPEWRNTYYFADTFFSWARAARFDDQDRLIDVRPFATITGFPVTLVADPAGTGLYYIPYGGFAALRRIVADCNANGQADVDEIRTCGGAPACSDCNANGLLDPCDISAGRSVDGNGNGIPDECETPACPGDADFDGMVGLSDIALMIEFWDDPVVPTTSGDTDGNGFVDLADLAIALLNWGENCP